jgi:hypothetical protein
MLECNLNIRIIKMPVEHPQIEIFWQPDIAAYKDRIREKLGIRRGDTICVPVGGKFKTVRIMNTAVNDRTPRPSIVIFYGDVRGPVEEFNDAESAKRAGKKVYDIGDSISIWQPKVGTRVFNIVAKRGDPRR